MSLNNAVFDHETRGWVDLIPSRKPQAKLTTNLEAKWLVIGAGFTGLSCARRLAELNSNDQIVLLDAREIGQNASGRNSGFAVAHSHFSGVYDQSKLSHYQRVDRINHAGLNSLRALIMEHNIDCDWQEQGFYHTAADVDSSKECDNFIDSLQKREIAHISLSQDQLEEQLGTKWYQKGVKVEGGALMQPAKLVCGLADKLPSNVSLYENTPVTEMILGKNIKLITPNTTITADKVVLACNYESLALNQPKQRIIGMTLSGSITRILSKDEIALLGNQSSWGVLSLHSGGATIRLTEDGRIALRNTAEYNNQSLLTDHQLLKRQQIHRESFINRFPQLSHVSFEHCYSGVEGVSANKTNIFNKLSKSLYFAGCYNGSGITKGTAFGMGIAEYVCQHESALVSDCLATTKANWLPPRPLLDIGAWFVTKQRFKGVGKDR